jgi:hypothetical protein
LQLNARFGVTEVFSLWICLLKLLELDEILGLEDAGLVVIGLFAILVELRSRGNTKASSRAGLRATRQGMVINSLTSCHLAPICFAISVTAILGFSALGKECSKLVGDTAHEMSRSVDKKKMV